MYANWFHILHTNSVKTNRGHCKGIPQQHMLYIWPIKENLERQWHRIQKQTMDRGFQKIKHRKKGYTNLLPPVQWKDQRLPQISESNNRKTVTKTTRVG